MDSQHEKPAAAPAWQPIGARLRRVAGVLVEKAKTTPDAYPLSLNAIVTGSNQKSNRDPVMTLDAEQADEALEQLRSLGAVVEVHGDGRVPRYRHLLYDWLGVEKAELSVMVELLLRGPQTLGELRGRAARMDPIPDLAALKPLVDSLMAKGLIISLTPPGRGQVVTHALYLPQELEKIRQRHGSTDFVEAPRPTSSPAPAYAPATVPADPPAPRPTADSAEQVASAPAAATQVTAPASTAADRELVEQVAQLRSEVSELRTQLAELKEDLREASESAERNAEEIRRLTDQLGG